MVFADKQYSKKNTTPTMAMAMAMAMTMTTAMTTANIPHPPAVPSPSRPQSVKRARTNEKRTARKRRHSGRTAGIQKPGLPP